MSLKITHNIRHTSCLSLQKGILRLNNLFTMQIFFCKVKILIIFRLFTKTFSFPTSKRIRTHFHLTQLQNYLSPIVFFTQSTKLYVNQYIFTV